MAGESKSSGLMPVLLVAAGLFFLIAGLMSGPPDVVGGIIFGAVFLAAAGAVAHRRARDAARAKAGTDPCSARDS